MVLRGTSPSLLPSRLCRSANSAWRADEPEEGGRERATEPGIGAFGLSGLDTYVDSAREGGAGGRRDESPTGVATALGDVGTGP